jgi:hypothetical protein
MSKFKKIMLVLVALMLVVGGLVAAGSVVYEVGYSDGHDTCRRHTMIVLDDNFDAPTPEIDAYYQTMRSVVDIKNLYEERVTTAWTEGEDKIKAETLQLFFPGISNLTTENYWEALTQLRDENSAGTRRTAMARETLERLVESLDDTRETVSLTKLVTK